MPAASGEQRKAAAAPTSLAVIAVSSATGFLSHLGQARIDLARAALYTAFAVAGSLAGHALAAHARPERLQRGFAGFVLVIGGVVAAQSLGLFH